MAVLIANWLATASADGLRETITAMPKEKPGIFLAQSVCDSIAHSGLSRIA
jgi:hypothetical protein